MFKQQMWMIPVAHWVGMLSAVYAVGVLLDGESLWWLAVWAVGHYFGGIIVSVALHRYWTHGAFQTNAFWHVFLACITPLAFQGSALAWAAAHQTHHETADTELDPHITAWHYLWWKRYRDVPMSKWRLQQLLSNDILLSVLHRRGLSIVLVYCLALYVVDPLLLLFGYLAPLGTVHLVGAIHQVSSHRGGHANDWPLLEFVFPAMGEWNHKYHHDHPRAARMGRFDPGWWFIRLIGKPAVEKVDHP